MTKTDIQNKASHFLKITGSVEGRLEEIKALMESLNAEKKALEGAKERARDSVRAMMIKSGSDYARVTDERTGETMVFTLKETPGRIELKPGITPEMLPPAFQRVKVEADKTAIKAALKPRPMRPGTSSLQQNELADLVDVVRDVSLTVAKEDMTHGQQEAGAGEEVGEDPPAGLPEG